MVFFFWIADNFYYNTRESSAQQQGRFVPSSAFHQNARTGFVQGGIPADRGLRNNQADSYQEQTLFIGSGNSGSAGGNSGGVSQQATTPNYYSSFPSFTVSLHFIGIQMNVAKSRKFSSNHVTKKKTNRSKYRDS